MTIWNRKTRILRAPENDGTEGGAGGAPPAGAPPAEPPKPFAVFESAEAFNKRINQATRASMREMFGTDSPDEVRGRLSELDTLKKAEDERKRQEMSELQRVQTDLANEKAARERAEGERNTVRFQAHVSGICAKLGVSNVEYALYLASGAVEKTPEGQQLDVEAHLKGLIDGDPKYKAAFGIAEPTAPVVQQQGAPITSTPNPGQGAPPPAPPGGSPTAPFDASKLSNRDFQAHLASLGVGPAGT